MSLHAFPHNRPLPVSWFDQLSAAGSEADVVRICRDFTAQLGSDELATLPEDCLPGHMSDAEDVTSYAFVLVRRHLEQQELGAPALHKLAAFFAHASFCLSRLLAARQEPGGQQLIA